MANGLRAAGDRISLVSLVPCEAPPWLDDRTCFSTLGARSRGAYPWVVARLASWLRHERVDVLHLHLFDATLVGLAAARIARTPVVCAMRHHTDEHWLLGKRAHVWIDRVAARAADHVVVPSQALRAHMREREGLTVPVDVVHIGFDFGALERHAARAHGVRVELGLGDAWTICCVGRLTPAKGLHELLEALALLEPDARLVLAGQGETAWLEERARELGVADRVLLAGFRSDAPAVMAACDVLAHPSHSDSFPQVLVEAMGVGTPVIASRVGGIPEIVEDGRTGVLVAPRESRSLADALRRLRSDPPLAAALAAAAGERVRAEFSAAAMVDRQLGLYRGWLAEVRS